MSYRAVPSLYENSNLLLLLNPNKFIVDPLIQFVFKVISPPYTSSFDVGLFVPIPKRLFALSHVKLVFCKIFDVPFPINICPRANVPTPVPPLSTVKIELSKFAEPIFVVVIA